MRGKNQLRVTLRGRDGDLVGGLGILFMGQWFGGRSVRTGGIAAVGVPPEERGEGAAEALMTSVLRGLRKRGVPISTLYPSNLRLYRKVGYEQVPRRHEWQRRENY